MIDYDSWCLRCKNYDFDIDNGILCKLTNAKPDFVGECAVYEHDPERDPATKHLNNDGAEYSDLRTMSYGLEAEYRNKVKSGANWFYWIAGLTIINTIVTYMDGGWTFIIGLGITQVADVLALSLAAELGNAIIYLAIFFDVIAIGAFALFGRMARMHRMWAFATGMILYALDGLIFLLASDIISIIFHGIALWGLYQGVTALKRLNTLESNESVPVE